MLRSSTSALPTPAPPDVVQIVDQKKAQPDVVHRTIHLTAHLSDRAAPAGLASERLHDRRQKQ
jgi:hypothetical protein